MPFNLNCHKGRSYRHRSRARAPVRGGIRLKIFKRIWPIDSVGDAFVAKGIFGTANIVARRKMPILLQDQSCCWRYFFGNSRRCDAPPVEEREPFESGASRAPSEYE
jgi:hypothetical protein